MTDPLAPIPPGEEPEPEPPRVPEPAAPAAPSVIAALSYGWTTFRANARPMLIAAAVPVLAQFAIAVASRVLLHSVAKWFLFQIVVIVVGAVASIGMARLALTITEGEEPDVQAAFRYDRWGPWVGFCVVFGLLEGVGLVLCVIPGVLFLAFFGLAPYFFLDRQLGIGDALRASRRAVKNNGLAFAVLFTIVVGALGLVLFFVGVFVTQSVAAIALAFLYRHATGETVGA